MSEIEKLIEQLEWYRKVGQQANDARHIGEPIEIRIARLEVLVCALCSRHMDKLEAEILVLRQNENGTA